MFVLIGMESMFLQNWVQKLASGVTCKSCSHFCDGMQTVVSNEEIILHISNILVCYHSKC